MRFQRWPDGGNAWTWFIWGRHPKWSATWTHSLSVSMERKGAWDAPRSWAKILLTRQSGRLGFYFRLGRLHGGLQRQPASPKPCSKEGSGC
jgi:hypothetical protein